MYEIRNMEYDEYESSNLTNQRYGIWQELDHLRNLTAKHDWEKMAVPCAQPKIWQKMSKI